MIPGVVPAKLQQQQERSATLQARLRTREVLAQQRAPLFVVVLPSNLGIAGGALCALSEARMWVLYVVARQGLRLTTV